MKTTAKLLSVGKGKKIMQAVLLLALTLAGAGRVAAAKWIDVTSAYLVNPSFDGNDRTTGWLGTPWGAANPHENAEHYEKTFDSYQYLTGLTPGRYRLSVQAFYRMGSASNDYNLFTSPSFWTFCLCFDSGNVRTSYNGFRDYGQSIRPVRATQQ